jgi:hypothetical protein
MKINTYKKNFSIEYITHRNTLAVSLAIDEGFLKTQLQPSSKADVIPLLNNV